MVELEVKIGKVNKEYLDWIQKFKYGLGKRMDGIEKEGKDFEKSNRNLKS